MTASMSDDGTMSGWAERVAAELHDLEVKMEKLECFLAQEDPPASERQLELMDIQAGIMCSYADILRARLDNAEN